MIWNNSRAAARSIQQPGAATSIALGALAALAVAACHQSTPGLAVVSVTDLGALGDPSAPRLYRDGGSSVLLGGRLLWSFGDTLFPFAAQDGVQLRTNTAALAAPDAPAALSEPLDAKGAPLQFVPFTADEAAFNAQNAKDGVRIALWPGAMVPQGADRALVIVDKVEVHPGTLNYKGLSTELALATPGSTSATRAGTLFASPEPRFSHGAVVRDGTLYLYACTPGSQCRIARAPLAQATQRSAYQFACSSGWSADLGCAAPLVPGSTAGHAVSWNAHLGRFLSASTPGFSTDVLLRTAPAPEGPWSDPVVAAHAPSAIYAVYLHDELQSADGKRVAVSYSRATGALSGEVRLLQLELE